MILQRQLNQHEAYVYQLQRTNEAHLSAIKDLTGEDTVSPDKTFDVNRPTYTDKMDLEALIKTCEDVCGNLKKNVQTDVLTVSTAKSSPGGLHSKSTVRTRAMGGEVDARECQVWEEIVA